MEARSTSWWTPWRTQLESEALRGSSERARIGRSGVRALDGGILQADDVPQARMDAELLLAHVLGASRMDLYMSFDKQLGEADRRALTASVRTPRQGARAGRHTPASGAEFGRSRSA